MLRPSLFARRFLSTSSTFTPRNATPETVDKLRQLLGDRLSTATSVREHHGKDESYHSAPPPDAVAFVTSTDEVSKVLQICSEAKTPVIPFGAGSSLEGHISAVCGGISLDLTGLNAILNVEPENMSCRVQAGVTRLQLESELRATGLFFPVDPGADATLGGMVATNASGTTTVRYGNMKANVLALTAVLANGQVIQTGSRARKSSAGYDLTRLLIGSEGTLAVVTEVELRLHGVPELQRLAVCSFPSIQQAVDTCTAIMQMGIPVARMEFMDEHTMAATNKYSKLHNAELPSLVIELNGTADDIENQTSMVEALTEEYDVQKVEWATSTEDRAELMKARHAAWYATLNLVPGSRGLSTDVCVPLSKLTQVIVDTQADLQSSNLIGNIVGHVGDGNFHVMLPFVPADYPQIQAFSDRLIERALAAGGTCTGEHGIGLGKKKYLALEHGGATTDVMRAIKAALDPHEILNPGKLF
ncbi:glycolate oxidase, subunit GlcD [Aphanomyces astaci]|uniref:D-lactate dehydrogenase (cytochrome) n=2 Tax=Aphanomyces astaci TaxID=112090 RepID=W4GUH6_APHAT|nr:glycolate oxidase, subunit GlcD [Aphanomyces astaci]ETV82971.1 glycolate oxidase, subunit GlcD [Aphanomyces astaci]|eukprot:XP_009827642.1 glycolate oxidase, subunit GlcD [Aphanomyces astaci]